jgi:hypothetical protein
MRRSLWGVLAAACLAWFGLVGSRLSLGENGKPRVMPRAVAFSPKGRARAAPARQEVRLWALSTAKETGVAGSGIRNLTLRLEEYCYVHMAHLCGNHNPGRAPSGR